MGDPTPKTCTRCRRELEPSSFGKNATNPDGLQYWCRQCFSERARERRDAMTPEQLEEVRRRHRTKMQARRVADPEGARQAMRDWREANPDRARELNRESRLRHLDAAKERDRRYREANAESIAAYYREYSRKNLQRRMAVYALWLAANPEKKAEYTLRRRAVKAKNSVGPVDLAALWTGRCGLCGDEIDPALKRPDVMSKSIDHIVPLSRGGAHAQDNLQWTHLTCNLSKGNRV